MFKYLKLFMRGTDILLGNRKVEIQRKKTLDIKKEIRLARSVRKLNMLQRSSCKIRRITNEALS